MSRITALSIQSAMDMARQVAIELKASDSGVTIAVSVTGSDAHYRITAKHGLEYTSLMCSATSMQRLQAHTAVFIEHLANPEIPVLTVLQPPELDIDKLMADRYGHEISADGRLERRIAWNLLKHLESHGWKAGALDDGDGMQRIDENDNPAKAAMELLFNLDGAIISLYQSRNVYHNVQIVLGNGVDIIADYSFAEGDADGFREVMDAFDAEQFA